jgi:hypothetical protein
MVEDGLKYFGVVSKRFCHHTVRKLFLKVPNTIFEKIVIV